MVQLSGLISGLDTASIVSQLVAVERAPANKLATNKSNLVAQESILASLGARMTGLADTLKGMDLASETRAISATVSDTAHVAIAASGTAATGEHSVRVVATARAQVAASRTFTSQDAGVMGVGSVTFNAAAGTPVSVSWDATDSLSAIADRMNAAGAGVTASVLKVDTGYRLLVRSNDTGTAGATTFTDAGDNLDLANAANITVTARDAQVSIDGVTITRSKNLIDDALPGVTLTLKAAHAATDADTLATVAVDHDASKAKVQKFVDAYNAVASLVNDQLTYSGTTKGADTLFGDSTLRGLQRTLSTFVADTHGGKSLSQLGISLDRAGKLSLDATKFDAAITKDGDAITGLFVTAGFATDLTTATENYTRGGTGLLAGKKTALDARMKIYQQQIDQINKAADALDTRLTADFTKLEQTMSTLQGQSSYIAKIG
ncbi:MAG: flagellar filament capping protein FliD [Deltaproteobacteria bacterium]|nr:flagellar filament capping protein FliD [Deltaproteobacteria bacterium]